MLNKHSNFRLLPTTIDKKNKLLEILEREFWQSASFTFNLPDSEVWLCGAPSVLDQICLHIIRNAMDAVSVGGQGGFIRRGSGCSLFILFLLAIICIHCFRDFPFCNFSLCTEVISSNRCEIILQLIYQGNAGRNV